MAQFDRRLAYALIEQNGDEPEFEVQFMDDETLYNVALELRWLDCTVMPMGNGLVRVICPVDDRAFMSQ